MFLVYCLTYISSLLLPGSGGRYDADDDRRLEQIRVQLRQQGVCTVSVSSIKLIIMLVLWFLDMMRNGNNSFILWCMCIYIYIQVDWTVVGLPVILYGEGWVSNSRLFSVRGFDDYYNIFITYLWHFTDNVLYPFQQTLSLMTAQIASEFYTEEEMVCDIFCIQCSLHIKTAHRTIRFYLYRHGL